MSDINVLLEGEELFSVQLELLIKIISLQKATASFVCDRLSNSSEQSDEFYSSLITEANSYSDEFLKELRDRKGGTDFDDLLKAR